jgi:hypothetical protein
MALCLHPAFMTKFQYNNCLKLGFKTRRVSIIFIQILAIMSIYREFNSACTAHLFFLSKNSRKITFPSSNSLCHTATATRVANALCNTVSAALRAAMSPHTFLSAQLPTNPKTFLTPALFQKHFSHLLNKLLLLLVKRLLLASLVII